MSRTGDTKQQILDIIERKNATLSDITGKLHLAPSTVSQHLKELVESGKIRLADDKPRKWKYYAINRPNASPYDRGFQMKSIVIPIGAVTLIAILAIGLYLSGTGGGVAVAQQVYIAPGSTVPTGSTVFSVSDSPQFYNLTALFITVTNVSIRSTSGKWTKIPLQEHTFNLVDLRNISEILSGVNLTEGSYDAISMSASNVTAIVNGTSHNVFLPSGRLLAIGRFNISPNSTNWVNIDFDLQKSIHITPNGTLILLPVVKISRQTGNDIDLNSTSILIAKSQPRMDETFECGMAVNGSMQENFSFAQNASIAVSGGRVVYVGAGQPQFLITTRRGIVIGPNAVWLLSSNFSGANGTATARVAVAMPMIPANFSGNWTANYTCKGGNGSNVAICNGGMAVPPGFSGAANAKAVGVSTITIARLRNGANGGARIMVPPPMIGGNASGYVFCRADNGQVTCIQSANANATANATVEPAIWH